MADANMEETEGFETITLKFDGGLATNGKLDFYEFGRSQYAFARFIATIEHFRRTGDVAESITSKTHVDIIVSSPQQGSFIESILVPAVVKAGADFIGSRLSSLLSYVWHLICPRRERTDEIVKELAEIKLAEEKEKTKQSREQTKQLQILSEIAKGSRATAEQAIELTRWAMATPNVAVGRLELSRDDYQEMTDELEAEAKRIAEFKDSEEQLKKIDEATLNKLTSRIRPMIPEMTQPLRRSAKDMYLGPSAKEKPFIFINKEIAQSLLKKESEEEPSEIAGRVRGYDRDAGVGKFTSPELPRTLNFLVPIQTRDALRDAVLEAMRRDKVILRVRKVIDQSGMPTSLILLEVVIPEESEVIDDEW